MSAGLPEPIRPLLTLGRPGLHRVLAAGHAVDPRAIADHEYLGISLGLPAWVDRLAWKTFVKTFHLDRTTGALRGWNVRLVQDGIGPPHTVKSRRGRPRTFGHYLVSSAVHSRCPVALPQGALVLDYGAGGNRRLDPASLAREPIVALAPGDMEHLFGWTWLDVGIGQLPTPSFFSLTRLGPLGHVVRPPR